MSRLKVAVVGCGHLGTVHARLLAARSDVELVAVVDPVPMARESVAGIHGCLALADPHELIGKAAAVVVAAPTGLHAAVSLPLLEAGIDLLIEKPIAAKVEQARSIVVAARRNNRVVAVGHVERFNPAWILAVANIGRVKMLESCRLAPFSFRSMDVGVVLDLMIHDIDLVLSLEPGRLDRIDAHGIIATGGHEDLPIFRRRASIRRYGVRFRSGPMNESFRWTLMPRRSTSSRLQRRCAAGSMWRPMFGQNNLPRQKKHFLPRFCREKRWPCQRPMRLCASMTISSQQLDRDSCHGYLHQPEQQRSKLLRV